MSYLQLSSKKRALLEALLREKGVESPATQRIPRRQQNGPTPLSFAQQRLWFFDQFETGKPVYNLAGAVLLKGRLNAGVLERSFSEIAQRHEALRTTFTTVEGQPVQVIAPCAARVPLPVADLRGLPPRQREAKIKQLATEEGQKPFDLERGPLLRTALLQLGEEEHVLLLTVHHIVFDGWSMGVLLRDLAAIYDALSAGKQLQLPELPIQYGDFAVWQRQWLSGEVLQTQLRAWKQQLDGAPPLLELPADRPRPAVQTSAGKTQSVLLSQELTCKLKNLSREEGVTLFMTLLAAFKALLHRYTGRTDLVVGSPAANRNRAEIEGLIGVFVNTLVLRTDLSGDPSFRELLQRVRERTMSAYAHQDLPFEKLVEELQPERSLSYNPVFQVMFQLRNNPMPPLELSGLTLSLLKVETDTTQFDLSLDMEEVGDSLQVSAEYSTDLFDSATIARMLGHFQTLLEGIVANREQRLSQLPVLAEAEKHQLLVEWNNTETDCPETGFLAETRFLVHELFEAQVERTPDAVAAVFEGQQLTYRQLNQRANQLARHLQQLGVQPEVLVGICAERSLEIVVGLLGILKAGGAYVPLDPAYPQERLAWMLEDSAAPVLLTQQHLLAGLPEHQAQIVCLDADWNEIAQQSADKPQLQAGPTTIAYVIYTSGSTGKPKGAANTHRGICNRLLWMQRTYKLKPTDRVLQKTPFSFDVSVWEFFWPLLAGARLVIARPGGHQDSAYLVNLIAREGITTLHFVPSMLQVFLEEKGLERYSSLKRVFCSGEALPFELQEGFFARMGCELHNLYGPTEAAIDVTFWQCQPESNLRTVPIGRPIANTQLYIVDSQLQLVPVGVPGELCIGGAGLARGYLNRPDLTAERFIPNPFSDKPGSRLYKTGDLARYLPDGNIQYLGRLDSQVKIRGFRIELGEIEAVLCKHPQVRESAVVVREGASGSKHLVAYAVAHRHGIEAAPNQLRQFLQERLPEYMVPSAFVLLEELPLTPNGKLDRQALPSPPKPQQEEGLAAPRSAVEQQLAAIWSEVLGIEQVGLHDNFFELGGDSILSIQIVAKANHAGIQLTPKLLFQHQTIAELAAAAGTAGAVRVSQAPVTGAVPLTPVQHWFFEEDFAEPHHWNQAVLLEVRQPLDAALLERAVAHLLAHHDALRLRFVRGEGGWEQVCAAPSGDVPVEKFDLSELLTDEQMCAMSEKSAQVQASLNLSEGPLVRFALFDLGAHQPNRLLAAIHHLAIDGVSWRILLEDLQTACEQLSRGEAVNLPPKTTSFKQWAEGLVVCCQSEDLKQEFNYWSEHLQKPVSPLPVDFAGGANTVGVSRTVSVRLSAEETHALLQEVPKVYRTQINDVLLAALVRAFSQWTGERWLLLDLEGHGREDIVPDADLSRTVGWFTSVFPVLLSLEGATGPGDELKSVKEQLRGIPNRGAGYGLLRYLTGGEIAQQLQAFPRAEVSFNYFGQFDGVLPESSFFGLSLEPSGPAFSLRGSRSYLLEINGFVAGGQLQMDWTYSEEIHRRSTVENLALWFVGALQSFIAHCQSPGAGGFTPSDFAEFQWSQWSQADLDSILNAIGKD